MSAQILEMEVMKKVHSDLNSPFVTVPKAEEAVYVWWTQASLTMNKPAEVCDLDGSHRRYSIWAST